MPRSRLASGIEDTEPLKVDAGHPFVEFRIPPDPAYVRIARLAAGDMGGRVGFSIDELDDVRLAVDEMCAVLIGTGASVIDVRMQARERTLIVEGRAPDARSEMVASELSEMLLGALVDSCVFSVRGREACVEMQKLAREIV
jgi:serine/threonine-protein kinase RsbW